MSNFSKVGTFMKTFGQEVKTKPSLSTDKINKLRIDFLNSVCENHHKTHYFQKKCSRLLSFFLTQEQVTLLINSIERSDENTFVKNRD